MWAAIFAVIAAIAKGFGAWAVYNFDPAMIKRRDDINKAAALESGQDAIDKALAGSNSLSLSFFISEFMRRKGETYNPAGWIADLLNRKLPTERTSEDRNKDPTPGIDIGK